MSQILAEVSSCFCPLARQARWATLGLRRRTLWQIVRENAFRQKVLLHPLEYTNHSLMYLLDLYVR